jgi:hypothetical protein
MMASVGTASRESRLAQRTETAAILGKAGLRSRNVRYGVVAEPESVVRAGFLDRFSRRRAQMPAQRSAEQSKRNHRHETDRTSLDIVHCTQSLCHAHSVTASCGQEAKSEKTIIA